MNRRLDREAPLPLYHQLIEELRAEIEQGDWRPGDLFATEADLKQRYRVSRATVRRALAELTREGRLVRVTGKGTFLAQPRLDVDLPHLVSFSEEIRARGMQPSTRVIEVRLGVPPAKSAQALGLREGVEALCVKRLRYADGEPLIYLEDYLHPRLGLREDDDFATSLYDKLEARVRIDEAVHDIGAILVPETISAYLGMDPGSPALRLERTTFDEMKRPVAFEMAVGAGPRYKYSLRLKRKGGLRGPSHETRNHTTKEGSL